MIENFKKDEDRINMEISCRTSSDTFIGLEERVYKVESTGASTSSIYSVSLLHQYCAKLPHDEYALVLNVTFLFIWFLDLEIITSTTLAAVENFFDYVLGYLDLFLQVL